MILFNSCLVLHLNHPNVIIKYTPMKKIYYLCLLSLTACGSGEEHSVAPQSFPEFVNGTLLHQNYRREYILHIPESYDGTLEVPLLVFLHGGSGSALSAQNFTNFNEVSDDHGFLMLYPQAAFEIAPDSYVWADGRGLPPDRQGIDDAGFIDALVSNLKNEYTIDAQRIYLCGFSNGSFLTQKIAMENNSQFAAFGVLGGTMSQSLYAGANPGRSIPMLFAFGTDDPLVPYEGGYVSENTRLEPVVGVEDAVDFWVRNNQCQTTLSPVDLQDRNTGDQSTVRVFEYTNGDCDARVKFYKINGGGHTFPGIRVSTQADLGTTNMDIDLNRELWDFFTQFALCTR